jgi:hypothetical protein
MERLNLKKLNEVEGKEQIRVEVSNRFAALEDLYAEVEINRVWEKIRKRGCGADSATDYYGRILDSLDRNHYYFFQVAPQLCSLG